MISYDIIAFRLKGFARTIRVRVHYHPTRISRQPHGLYPFRNRPFLRSYVYTITKLQPL